MYVSIRLRFNPDSMDMIRLVFLLCSSEQSSKELFRFSVSVFVM
jgi:hypothetical protein